MQDIVDDARVSKPTLYYYFGNKAGLYQALGTAFDERRLIQPPSSAGRRRPISWWNHRRVVAFCGRTAN